MAGFIGDMYAKVFAQIFDSSIAENYEVRHVFEDLLKLADRDGVVDMTLEAVARRTNVPLEKVEFAIGELSKPDPESRSKEHEGRRLVPIDSGRTWGWLIVNYQHYRDLRDEEARRGFFRDAKRRQREREGKPARRRRRRQSSYDGGPLPGEGMAGRLENAADITTDEMERNRAELNGDQSEAMGNGSGLEDEVVS